MKTIKVLITAFSISIFLSSCMDSKEKPPEKEITTQEDKTLIKKDTTKQMNLLDEQAKMLGKVFGNSDSEEGDKWKKVSNYMDLVDQANFPPDIKKHLTEQYKLYDLSLDPKKKDSLKLVFNKKLTAAMAKSVANPK